MSVLKGLKICFIAGTLGQGGAERQLFYQLRTLVACGAQPAVLCFSEGEYWQKPIEALGVPVIALAPGRSRLGRLVQVCALARRLTPDIMQSVHFYTNVYAVMAARLLGLIEIGAVRSDAIRDIAESGALGGQLSWRLPRILAANSKNAIQALASMGCRPEKLIYLPNVVDTVKFSPRPLPVRSEIHLIMVGRMVYEKRFDIFLRVLATLTVENTRRIIGHLVGDGPDKSELQALAGQLGLGPEQACFHGAVAEVENLYPQADICLHLSDWEGTPNTILEAMACCLPVVASRVGGIPELIRDGHTGFLVETGDQVGLLVCLRRLISDPALRAGLGASAREYVVETHALTSLPKILEQFYEGILS